MSISTLSFNNSTRASLLRLQTSIAEANQEVNTGRHVDVGRTLGRLTGSAVSARAEETSFKEQRTSNGLVKTRLTNIDASLATLSEGAESVANNLIASGVSTNFDTLVNQARSGLQTLTGALNAKSDGQYLFGGINTNTPPVATESAAVDAQAAAISQNFADFVAAATGGGTDPSLVTAGAMKDYLGDGFVDTAIPPVTHKFGDVLPAAWTTASEDAIESRIGRSETVVSSASANEPAFRTIALAYTMLSSLGLDKLNSGARTAVTTTAATLLKGGSYDITTLRADVGIRLKRIEASDAELLRQQDIMTDTVSKLENVDITEASLRVVALQTQLEVAYKVTGQIQNLSILDYL